MADTVSTKTIWITKKSAVIVAFGSSDGTGETDAIKVDKSTLVAATGAEPAALGVDWIQYDIQGYTSIALEWDLGTDELIARLGSGTGVIQFAEPSSGANGAQPVGTGGTGDIVLTTSGHISGATYTIVLGVSLEVT